MKRNTLLSSLATGLMLAGLTSPASGADYVNNPQLSEAINPHVKSCRKFDTLPVPMKVSGGDIITLFANGQSLTTTQDSIMSNRGVDVKLYKETDFRQQVRDFLACDTPIMRATQGQINQAAELTEENDKTSLVALYKSGWSNGSATLVARGGINTPADLSGKTIVLQAYGPHVGFASQVLKDAEQTVESNGGTWQEPTLVWTENLEGLQDSTPASALQSDNDVDAAFVIRTDANVLTGGRGNTGTGAEGSVKGAEVIMSTKEANRVISNVYVTRQDYYEAHREQLQNFVTALYEADEKAREKIKKLTFEFEHSAEHLLEDSSAIEEVKELWRDTETVGWKGNKTWMTQRQHPKSWLNINNTVQQQMLDFGVTDGTYTLATAEWDFAKFNEVLFDTRRGTSKLPSFDSEKAAKAVDNAKEDDVLFETTILFSPNQKSFPESKYKDDFQRVIELSSTYGGAVLTITGHSDPMGYLKKKYKENAPASELRQIKQSAKNLSLSRAISVRKAIMSFAEERSITLDESQFVVKGKGITEPATGIKGQDSCTAPPEKIKGIQVGDPCPAFTREQWESNRRVKFEMIQLKSESEAFTPANTW